MVFSQTTIDEYEWPKSSAKVVVEQGFDGKNEVEFNEELAIAVLLIEEVLFCNDHWWMKDWPDEAKDRTSLNVNCNDVFAWGCSDAETLPHSQLENLWHMWRKDPEWGPAIWCMQQRRKMPQKPVEDRIKKAGIWDLKSMNLEKSAA
jgi:hypothetical protein